MSSQVDIYNLALSHVGDKANVASLVENSLQAQLCNRFYPNCLRKILSAHPWSFAKTRASLNGVTSDLAEVWDYKYSAPNLLVTPLAVFDAASRDDNDRWAYSLEGAYVFTNASSASMLYVFYQDNTGVYSASFEEALSRILASRLAGPIIKGAMGRQERDGQYKAYLYELGIAKAEDSNKSNHEVAYVPSSVSARGGLTLMALDDVLSERNSRLLR